MRWTRSQQERFARHLSMPEIGVAGQKKLLAGKVLVVGAGGLGSPAALYLAAAGVGMIGVVDADTVSLSNLQRQILHTTRDVGRRKVDSARDALRALNPEVKVRVYPVRLTPNNAPRMVPLYDFVIDATDNLEARQTIAEACHRFRRPYSHGGILRFYGETMTVHPGKSACYRCLYPELPRLPTSLPQGPLGVVPGVIGALQAAEAIKYVLGIGKPLLDTLLIFDILDMSVRPIRIKRNRDCPLCGACRSKRGRQL